MTSQLDDVAMTSHSMVSDDDVVSSTSDVMQCAMDAKHCQKSYGEHSIM